MKRTGAIFFYALIALSCTSASILDVLSGLGKPRDELNDQINQLLDCVKNVLNTGNSDLGIPPLNPLIIDKADLTLDDDTLRGNVTVGNLNLKGITDFAASLEQGDTFLLEINFPGIILETDYSANVKILTIVPVNGNGKLSLSLSNLNVSASVALSLSPLAIQLEYLTLKLGSYNFDVSGLLNDEQMNNLVSNQIRGIIDQLISENPDGLDVAGLLGDFSLGDLDLDDLDLDAIGQFFTDCIST